MRYTRLVAGTLCLFGAAAIAASCLPPFDPCPDEEGFQDRGQMEWKWELTSVNGGALPVNHPNPAKNETLQSLWLYFDTDRVNPPSCAEDAEKSDGMVSARAVTTKDGISKLQRFTGRFSHDHKTNTTTLYYLGYQVDVTRNGTEITARSSKVIAPTDEEKLLFLFAPTYTLQFVRTVGP